VKHRLAAEDFGVEAPRSLNVVGHDDVGEQDSLRWGGQTWQAGISFLALALVGASSIATDLLASSFQRSVMTPGR
jgi:hypothetical protein